MSLRFRLADDVLYQALGDEAIVLNINDSHYYGLDDVATRMWQVLVEQGDADAVVAQMVAEYDVDEPTVRRDLSNLLAEMERRGLIRRVEP